MVALIRCIEDHSSHRSWHLRAFDHPTEQVTQWIAFAVIGDDSKALDHTVKSPTNRRGADLLSSGESLERAALEDQCHDQVKVLGCEAHQRVFRG